MKKNKTKPALASTELRGEPSTPGQKCNLVLKCDYRLEDFIYWPRPSELELAQLAARLGGASTANPKQSATRAWKLYWECCRIIQEDHRKVQAQLDFDDQQDRNYDVGDWPEADAVPIPAPKKFPVPYASPSVRTPGCRLSLKPHHAKALFNAWKISTPVFPPSPADAGSSTMVSGRRSTARTTGRAGAAPPSSLVRGLDGVGFCPPSPSALADCGGGRWPTVGPFNLWPLDASSPLKNVGFSKNCGWNEYIELP